MKVSGVWFLYATYQTIFESGYFMKLIQFAVKHKGKIIIALLLAVIIITAPLFDLKNYGVLLDADIMYIYKDNTLVTTVNNPADIMDTFNGSVAISLTDTSYLGIRRISMAELYRLEFVKDGKIISKIKILTPRTQKAIDKIDQNNLKAYWKQINGHYIIMTENFQYFSFGEHFFENLSEILKQS